jgi:DNA-binding transcriptional regulator LsrR (DeoR family)
MHRKDENIEFQAQVAAWLFDKMHFKQEQIAEHLGIKQPDVSRRLKLAEERGWLSRPSFLRGKDITEQRML